MRKLKPVTPGELLLEEFLKPMGISRYRLAFRRSGSGTLSPADVPLPPIPICDYVVFSVYPTATGYALRQHTTPKLLNAP
jgi:hypothetical protein